MTKNIDHYARVSSCLAAPQSGRSPPLPTVEPKVEAAYMRLPEVHNCAHFRARQTMVAHGIIPAQRILPLLETVNL